MVCSFRARFNLFRLVSFHKHRDSRLVIVCWSLVQASLDSRLNMHTDSRLVIVCSSRAHFSLFSVLSLNSKHSSLRLLIVCWPRALSRLFKLASLLRRTLSSSCSRSRLFRLVSESVPMLAIHRLEKARDEDTITNRETVSFLWKLASLNRLGQAQNKHTITNRKYACFPVTALTWKHARRVCVCDSRDVMRMSFETSDGTCRKLILADGVFSSQLSEWKTHPFRTAFRF